MRRRAALEPACLTLAMQDDDLQRACMILMVRYLYSLLLLSYLVVQIHTCTHPQFDHLASGTTCLQQGGQVGCHRGVVVISGVTRVPVF